VKIAIIPARGGSKRIPNKNIKEFFGVPILLRTLRILSSSELFDRIIVSTDSEEISEISLQEPGVEISPRESFLSSDSVNIIEVMAGVIKNEKLDSDSDISCVYAPNPFLKIDALALGLQLLRTDLRISYVSSVTSYAFPIQRSLKFSSFDGRLEIAESMFSDTHSQNLEVRFHETAQFWWAKALTWVNKYPMQSNVRGIYIPRWMVQDIDTPEDWDRAELIWEFLNKNPKYYDYKFSDKNIINSKNFRV